MKQSTVERMTTTGFLPTLSGSFCSPPDTKVQSPLNPDRKVAPCVVCFKTMPSRKCDEGHAVCAACIEQKILRAICAGNHVITVVCPLDGCSTTHEYLYGYISGPVFTLYLGNQDSTDAQIIRIEKLPRGFDRGVAMLSFFAAQDLKKCPNLVVITPVPRASPYPTNESIAMVPDQKFQVVFFCAHSFQPGHEPFEIEAPNGWMDKVVPWLNLCLQALKLDADSHASSVPAIQRMLDLMDSSLDSVNGHGPTICECSPDERCRQVKFGRDAFTFIAEKANKLKIWKDKMALVNDTHRGLLWVNNKYAKEYI